MNAIDIPVLFVLDESDNTVKMHHLSEEVYKLDEEEILKYFGYPKRHQIYVYAQHCSYSRHFTRHPINMVKMRTGLENKSNLVLYFFRQLIQKKKQLLD